MSDARTSAPPAGTELRLIVWQFVRIMVQLETVSRVRGRERGPSVYQDWRGSWTEIDRTLERLGKTDSEAFADLMMNQEVVLRCRDRSQVNEVSRTAENVVAQLDELLKEARGDAKKEEELQFERREMKALVKHLRRQGRSGNKARSGAPKPATPASPPRRGKKRKG
jgi:hypothetical protein